MKRHAGFTLTELMMVLVVMGIVLAFAFPSFRDWLLKLQIRTSAESVLHGLQLSRAEAVKRNATVNFTLSGGTGWSVSDGATTIQTRPSGEGTSTAYIAVTSPSSTLPYTLSFNGLGRLAAPNSAVSLSFTNTAGGACTASGPVNCLVVQVTVAGQIRMCNPAPDKVGTPMAC